MRHHTQKPHQQSLKHIHAQAVPSRPASCCHDSDGEDCSLRGKQAIHLRLLKLQ